ncbi:MAG: signal recognition particle-docking protein FtsY, partial [Deltaproteobacteria bacterium]|nr:signal recognition particle-docking protein FtsY [Deltaproteobacteria bacterium]
TWLVIDGVTGQNAIAQAREFNAALALSGVVVTKLDGTQKGGVVVAIKSELGVPVRYIGVGEGIEDLRPFEAAEFVEALFGEIQSVGNASGSSMLMQD